MEETTIMNIEENVTPKKRGRKPKTVAVNETTVKTESTEKSAPKKKGRKPKTAADNETAIKTESTEKSAPKKKGTWSDDRITDKGDLPIIADRMKIEIQLLDKSLGMAPSNPDSLRYVAKNPDETNIYSDRDDINESRDYTVWPRAKFIPGNADGVWVQVNEPNCPQVDPEETSELPFIFDYQIRGMFKDDCGLLSRAKNNVSSELKAYKKQIDGNIFVLPRKIAFNVADSYIDDNGDEISSYNPETGKLNMMARPLRISGPTGERSAIAISEVMPPMSTIKFEILITNKNLRPVIEEWLDYGLLRGLGQWRNSGIGIYRWRELGDDWQPIDE